MTETTEERIALLRTAKTLPDLVRNRAARSPDDEALREFDRTESKWISLSFGGLEKKAGEWQRAYAALGMERGNRVAILLPNCINAVCADQGALAAALTPVPLHAADTPGAWTFILIDSQASVLVTNKLKRWTDIMSTSVPLPDLQHVIFTAEDEVPESDGRVKLHTMEEFLASGASLADGVLPDGPGPDDLGAVVYTSGTLGRPKGVMLTHANFLANISDTPDCVTPKGGDVFLSFLPISHTFERTLGYYLALGMGCTVVFNRSIMLLAEDFKIVKPTVIISVPRVYERIYARIAAALEKKGSAAQNAFEWAVEIGWRKFCRKNGLPVEKTSRRWLDFVAGPLLYAKVAGTLSSQFGGRLRVAISGGAAINAKVARTFCGLGLPIIQGYGMTETSPVISGNSLSDNNPLTVGHPFTSVEVRLGENDEIQVRGPSVMKGYWNRQEATKSAFTEDGWLRTGDVGRIENSRLSIKGRIKEIIVTSTGEKVPPADVESAIEVDPLFAQTFIVGEDRPYIALIAVVATEEWKKLASSLNLDPGDPASLDAPEAKRAALKRAKAAAADFPHYALPRAATLTTEPWTIENGLITPTLKIKRDPLKAKFRDAIGKMYKDPEP